jgi:hypothetical protein
MNSGTYLAFLDPAAKRAILFVMALGTLFFPLVMIPVLYYRKLVSDQQNPSDEEKLVPMLIILVLYIITFVYFLRLPLSRFIQAYALSAPLLLFLLLLLHFSLKIKLCAHSTGMGGMTGLVISLIILFSTPLLGILLIILMAAGLTGTARLLLGEQRPAEIYGGYLLGLAGVTLTLLIY